MLMILAILVYLLLGVFVLATATIIAVGLTQFIGETRPFYRPRASPAAAIPAPTAAPPEPTNWWDTCNSSGLSYDERPAPDTTTGAPYLTY